MKVALVQTSLFWEDKNKNLQHFTSIIESQKEPIDVFVLPEMFTTGFSMNSSQLSEKLGDSTTQWMIHLAFKKNACIVGSFITTDEKNYFNTLVWAYPDRQYQYYHKRHLFRMAGEDKHYTAGTRKTIIEYKGIRFLPLICYDLRFPVWSRNKIGTPEEYDVLLYVANWPEVRIDAWKKLLDARSIENLCYTIGVNRIGIDGTGKPYNGQSKAVNFKGEVIASLEDKDTVKIIEINKQELMSFREKFPAYLDADNFEIYI